MIVRVRAQGLTDEHFDALLGARLHESRYSEL